MTGMGAGEWEITGVGGLWLGGEGCVLPFGGRLHSHWKEWEKIQRLPAFPQAITG